MAEALLKKKIKKGRDRDLIFYCLMMLFPISQFAVFYIGVNFNSFLLAFQKIDLITGNVTWSGQNIAEVFRAMTTSAALLSALKSSVLSCVILMGVGTPLGLLFSYYIYKKLPLSGGFRVILFLPSIISAIVMVTIFQFFVERAVPDVINQLFYHDAESGIGLNILGTPMKGLLENTKTRYGTIIFYNIWVGFGTNVLLYSNGMSGISQEIVESAQLDGAKGFKEFWYITLPLVYPTMSTFLITGVAGLFSNQLNLYSFFGAEASVDIQTYGYYLYTKAQTAASPAEYPPLSAMGLLLTCVAVPLTLIVKRVLERFTPEQD